MIASAEPSMSCTKTTPASLCTVSATFSGSRIHWMISGIVSLMSLFLHVAAHVCIAAVASSFTCGLTSHISVESTGMMSLMHRPVCAGNALAIMPISCARPRFVCHLFSYSARSMGMTLFTPCSDSLEMSA